MTILFVGGEDSDFSIVCPSYAADTTVGRYRSTHARHAMKFTDATISNVLSFGVHLELPAAQVTTWTTWRGYYTTTGSGAGWGMLWAARSGGANPKLFVTTNLAAPASAVYRLIKRDAAGTETTLYTSSTVIVRDTLNKYDVFCDYKVAGTFQLYIDGVLAINYSGDLTVNGATSLAKIHLGPLTGSIPTTTFFLSEVIVADEDTRNMALATLTPLAAGNTQAWTGAVGNINEAARDDSAVLTAASAAQLAQFTVTPASILSSAPGLRALAVNARASKGSSGPQNLQAVVRTGSADYASASLSGLGKFTRVANVWNTNPQTGMAWTAAQLIAAGFNIGVKAVA